MQGRERLRLTQQRRAGNAQQHELPEGILEACLHSVLN